MFSRNEAILNAILNDEDISNLPVPQSREEALLLGILDKIRGGGGGAGKELIHICTANEYNQITGVPTVSSPSDSILYLVPASSATTGNLFDEWVYADSKWERVGSVNVTVPVQDVQVNGVSVLDAQGVANVPIADTDNLGVVKINNSNGIQVSANGALAVIPATPIQIKNAATNYRTISPYIQHESAFYGLAKAAGDTTQSASNNAVGAYTDAAKVAIQKMLGIYQPPWELLNDITLTEEGRIDLTADANGTPYDMLGVYIKVYYAANLETASTGYARYICEDSSGVMLFSETSKYNTQTSPYAKFIYILRDGPMAIAVFSKSTTTGGAMTWLNKYNTGIEFDFKNIQHIYMNTADVEPAGTRIQIYGQRAY